MKYLSIIENPTIDSIIGIDLNSFIIVFTLLVMALYLGWVFILKKERPVYLEHRIRKEWTIPLPFYRVYCKIHGYFETYPQGYNDTLICPKCFKERFKDRKDYRKREL